MKSIRLSLVFYFLLLVALALGAISLQVHWTTKHMLVDNQTRTKKLLEDVYQNNVQDTLAALDHRILQQALKVAKQAKESNVHFEFYYPLGAITEVASPLPHLTIPLWFAERFDPQIAEFLFEKTKLRVDSPDRFIPTPDHNLLQPQEYMQTNHVHGEVLQRTASLGEYSLESKSAKDLDTLQEDYSDMTLPNGKALRVVTLKTPVLNYSGGPMPPSFVYPPGGFGGGGKGGGPGFGGGPKGKGGKGDKGGKGPGGMGRGDSPDRPRFQPPPQFKGLPEIVIHYASDTSILNEKLERLAEEHKGNLEQLDVDTQDALAGLRTQLTWIIGITFVCVLAGGYLLVLLGLAPLNRLSEAVSQVSERDFRLKVDSQHLPGELKPIASRITRTLEQLERAFTREKQASADISHELRTPLAALLTTVELALRKSRSPEEYRELLQECHFSGKQMYHLVERLLALARLDAGADRMRTQEVDVVQIARQCVNLVRPLAEEKGLTMNLDAPDALTMHTDADKLREILNNLLHNAVEYNRPSGAIKVNIAEQEGSIIFEVRDTGIGITADVRSHIFERFYRADPSRHADSPHAGLGLSIVKSYVDLMDGQISVESDGQGSIFRVELPV